MPRPPVERDDLERRERDRIGEEDAARVTSRPRGVGAGRDVDRRARRDRLRAAARLDEAVARAGSRITSSASSVVDRQAKRPLGPVVALPDGPAVRVNETVAFATGLRPGRARTMPRTVQLERGCNTIFHGSLPGRRGGSSRASNSSCCTSSPSGSSGTAASSNRPSPSVVAFPLPSNG